MDKEEEYTELDKAIADFIETKTPRYIAERTGVTPERVIARAEEMKDEVDALSIDAQLYFLTRRLNVIASEAQQKARNTPLAKDASGLYSAATQAISTAIKQLNTLKKENDTAKVELNRKRQLEILRLFDVVIELGSQDVSDTYGLDKTEVLTKYQNKIVQAAMEIENK